jgi:ribosomal protein S18 acetylase RimI-like enzyme
MKNIILKRVNPEDLAKLQHIGRQTFLEAFAAANTEENMTHYLSEGFSTEKLSTELHDAHSEFYFACLGEKVIGYLKVNFGPSQTDLKDDKSLEIERIYVLKEFHGQQVGQMLFNKAIQIAKQRHADYVWLGVWEHNPRAIQFYKKNGFVEFDRHIFHLGHDAQTDIMMKRKLNG